MPPVIGHATRPVIADCCSSTDLHDELAPLLNRYNVNEFAASVKVYAVKPG